MTRAEYFRARRIRLISEGRCSICGDPIDCESKRACHACLVIERERKRKPVGATPWSKPGIGRQPFERRSA